MLGYNASRIAKKEEYIPPYTRLSRCRICWNRSPKRRSMHSLSFLNLLALQLIWKENTSCCGRAFMGLVLWSDKAPGPLFSILDTDLSILPHTSICKFAELCKILQLKEVCDLKLRFTTSNDPKFRRNLNRSYKVTEGAMASLSSRNSRLDYPRQKDYSFQLCVRLHNCAELFDRSLHSVVRTGNLR